MFTGIVQGTCPVVALNKKNDILEIGIQLENHLSENLTIGASVAVDGVCLTVTTINETTAYFDAIPETLQKTTLGDLALGNLVNIERAARIGDEIGGHLVSGHVWGKAYISHVERSKNSRILTFICPPSWTKYLFPKGFIAINGASLTLVDVRPQGEFTVHLIPETLRKTTFENKGPGDAVNIEIEAQTQTIVDAVERILLDKLDSLENIDSMDE